MEVTPGKGSEPGSELSLPQTDRRGDLEFTVKQCRWQIMTVCLLDPWSRSLGICSYGLRSPIVTGPGLPLLSYRRGQRAPGLRCICISTAEPVTLWSWKEKAGAMSSQWPITHNSQRLISQSSNQNPRAGLSESFSQNKAGQRRKLTVHFQFPFD